MMLPRGRCVLMIHDRGEQALRGSRFDRADLGRTGGRRGRRFTGQRRWRPFERPLVVVAHSEVVGGFAFVRDFEVAPGLELAARLWEIDGDVVLAGGEVEGNDETGAREHFPSAGVGLA